MEVTLTPRSIGLIVAAAVAAGWVGASVLREAPPAQTRVPSARRPLGVQTVPRADRLRERVQVAPLPNLGRNPFVYGQRVARPPIAVYGDAGRSAVADAPPAATAPAPSPLPVVRLSGIASNTDAGTTTLTAIINDNGALVFAKAGDKLPSGYSVVKVDDMSVTLADAAGATQILRLP